MYTYRCNLGQTQCSLTQESKTPSFPCDVQSKERRDTKGKWSGVKRTLRTSGNRAVPAAALAAMPRPVWAS